MSPNTAPEGADEWQDAGRATGAAAPTSAVPGADGISVIRTPEAEWQGRFAQTPPPGSRRREPAPPDLPGRPHAPGNPVPTASALLTRSGSGRDAGATWGWQGLLRRWSGGLVSPGPSAAELGNRADLISVRRSLREPKTIVFANPKGGAGKTPATLVAAATFGTSRGGYVVAWDNNETRGTLGLRADAGPWATTVWDLLAKVEDLESANARVGDLASFVRSQGEAQFDVLASDENASNMASIGQAEFRRILGVLARFYRIICVDTGNNVRADNWQAAMSVADQLVVCSTYGLDHGYSASWMLDHLVAAGRAALVANAVTILSADAPRIDKHVRHDLTTHFAARTRSVHEIPYDRSIGGGETISFSALRPATRAAWLRTSAVIAEGL